MPVTWGGGLEPPALWVPPLPEVPTVAPPDVPAALPVVADPAPHPTSRPTSAMLHARH